MVKVAVKKIFIYTPENPFPMYRFGGSTIRFLGFAHLHKVKFLIKNKAKNYYIRETKSDK